MAEHSRQELREKTGAGMMDCKKALKETDGDMTSHGMAAAKGITSADKKSRACAAEGLVGSCIHRRPSRCVSGGKLRDRLCGSSWEFQTLVRNIAYIAACPNVEYVKIDDIPNQIVQKEIEMGRDDLANSQITSKKRLFRVGLKSA